MLSTVALIAEQPITKGYSYSIGEYRVFVKPMARNYSGSGKQKWESIDSDGNPISKDLYRMTFDDNRLYLLENELILNSYSYGEINQKDKIEIINKVVYINNTKAEGRLLSKEFRVSLSSEQYFSSAKLGSHTVFVAPGLGMTTTDIEKLMGIYIYTYIVGETHVSISNDSLSVNGKGYGNLKENSIIIIEEGEVFVNDKDKIKEIDTNRITDL